ncbi:MAG TPA: hypothetical protein VGF34_08020 [Stellaceae bacterium]
MRAATALPKGCVRTLPTAGLAVVALLAGSPAPRADTILWANDGRGSPGPTLDEWNINEAAGTGTLINSFAAPNPVAQRGGPGGIAILGTSIYYGVSNSGSVFLTNPAGADLGVAFDTGLPGISAITSDGTFLYIAATGDSSLTEKVYQYTLGGNLVNTLTLVPTAGGPFLVGRTGLEIVGGNFVANQGNDQGPYNKFDSAGNLVTTEFLQQTDDFGFSGVAFDGAFYYVADVEDQPSIFRAFDAAGNLLKEIALTGCPGPNQQCDFADLAVEHVVPEPTTLGLVVPFLLAAGLTWRTRRGGTFRTA